jgi:hypothetical protein
MALRFSSLDVLVPEDDANVRKTGAEAYGDEGETADSRAEPVDS